MVYRWTIKISSKIRNTEPRKWQRELNFLLSSNILPELYPGGPGGPGGPRSPVDPGVPIPGEPGCPWSPGRPGGPMIDSPLGPFRDKKEHYKIATNYLLQHIINNLWSHFFSSSIPRRFLCSDSNTSRSNLFPFCYLSLYLWSKKDPFNKMHDVIIFKVH